MGVGGTVADRWQRHRILAVAGDCGVLGGWVDGWSTLKRATKWPMSIFLLQFAQNANRVYNFILSVIAVCFSIFYLVVSVGIVTVVLLVV